MIEIQTRDRKILKLCYEQQFILTEQVKRYFANDSYKECRRRIDELKQAGYLKNEITPILGKTEILRLTRIGRELAKEGTPFHVTELKKLRLVTLTHDAVVTEARLRLEAIWSLATFVPERAIKKNQFRQIPDGLFLFPSGNSIALEIENSDKGKTRFIKILKRWSDVPKVVFVLFIATHPILFESIKKWLPEGPKDQPMGVVLWEHLKIGTPLVWTKLGQVPLFEKREF